MFKNTGSDYAPPLVGQVGCDERHVGAQQFRQAGQLLCTTQLINLKCLMDIIWCSVGAQQFRHSRQLLCTTQPII